MRITNERVLSSPKLNGRVRRYHTWPMLQEQTVADHVGNVLRIYWTVFGSVPSPVCAYILWHDVEIRSGDAPHPVKSETPGLKDIMDQVEYRTLIDMVGVERARQTMGGLSDVERVRVKACDLLEMWEHAAIDVKMGNQFADPVIENCVKAIDGLALSEEDCDAVVNYIETEIGRFDN